LADALRLALIAHDQKKDDPVAFAGRHDGFPATCDIVATGTARGRVGDACPGLAVRRPRSVPLTALPHDADVKAPMRLAIVDDHPLALSRASAEVPLQPAQAVPRSGRETEDRCQS
jgi:methylglyoxal synthase